MAKKDFKKFTGKVISPTGKKAEERPVAEQKTTETDQNEANQKAQKPESQKNETNSSTQVENQTNRKAKSQISGLKNTTIISNPENSTAPLKTAGLNFKVTPEFKTEFKIEAARNGMKMNEYLEMIYYFFQQNSQKSN